MKWILLILLLTSPVWAQTAVTATITDSDSQTWNNGTWTATLVSPSGPPSGCTTATTVSGTMSSSGVLTGSLCDTSLIGPSGATWRFTICPNASANCSQISTGVTGATENLSTVLSNGITAPRFAASFAAHGYADVEVTPTPPPGATYYNVTTPAFRQWSGSAWAAVGGVGSGNCSAVGSAGVLQAATGSGGLCQASSVVDNGTTVTTSEVLTVSGTGNAQHNAVSTSATGGDAQYSLATTGTSGFTFISFSTGNGGLSNLAGIYDSSSNIFDVTFNSADDLFGFVNSSGTTSASWKVLHTGAATFTGVTTGTLPVPGVDTASPTPGQAVCIKSAGPPISLGTCSTVVSSGGACTCS